MEPWGGKVIYPELSYKIVGIIFEVFNDLGYGYLEKYYQKALAAAFRQTGIKYRAQCSYRVMYKKEMIGRNFIDFIIEDRIVFRN